jgi:TM2 domain-containing membrane protein YozV
MKKFILLIGLLSLFLISAKAQNYEDVVYLKNGSIIRGLIIEQIPNQTIKIQTKDRNVFVFTITEIEKIAKEEIIKQVTKGPRKLYPGVAFALSSAFPGVGQMYNKQYTKGAIMMGIEIISPIILLYSVYGLDEGWDGDGPLNIIGYSLYGANIIWTLIDAPVSANAINRKKGLSINYDLNKNIHFALKPDYQITNINGNFYPVYGAKLSFSFN